MWGNLPVWRLPQVTTGDVLPAWKSLMRMRIDRSIAYPTASADGTQRTSLYSLLGVGCPLRARAVSTIENSWRTSPSDVYRITCLGSE